MKNRNIILSAADHAELGFVIASGGKISERASAELKGSRASLNALRSLHPRQSRQT
jgi:hypothetical protein